MEKKKAAQGDQFQTEGNYTMPAPDSQNAEILTILQSGRLLTSYEMHMMGIQGAATRVMEYGSGKAWASAAG